MGYKSGQNIGIRLVLLRDYLNAHAGKTQAVKREELHAYLEAKGFPVERKTLYTDLQLLETYFGMELRYEPRLRGYILENPQFEPYEIRLLVDCINSAKFITQEKTREITRKIKQLTNEETRRTLDRQVIVAERVRSMNDSVINEVDKIHDAIQNDSKIAFRYFHFTIDKSKPKNYSKNGDSYSVSPFALLWNNGNYYLYAYVSERKQFRVFRVDRMERISVLLDEPREGKEEFNKKEVSPQKAKVFDMYRADEYSVSIRFINRFASAVIDQFGKDIIMIPVDENHFTIRAPVEVSPPFYAWVATFGKGAKILNPPPVVDGMKQFLQKAADMYEEAEDT